MSDLKAFGLWSKMKAIYPFVTDQRNLAGYSEDITNAIGWSSSIITRTANTAIAPNGTLTADTFTTTSNANNAFWNLGWITGNGQTFTNSIYLKYNNAQWVTLEIWSGTGQDGIRLWVDVQNGVLGTANATVGTYLTSSISNEGNGWYRVSVTGIMPSTNNALLALRHVDGNGAYNVTAVNGKSTFCWGAQNEIGTLTAYQSQLGSAQSAIASQFKYNLVNPVDSDAAFRLVFNGGWTHSSNGAQGNGVNSFANPFLSSSANLQLNSAHVSYYSRTNSAANMVMMGTQSLYVLARWTQYHGNNSVESDQGGINTGNTTAGFFMSNRTSGSAMKYQINNSIQTDSTSTAATASIQENLPIYLGCQNTAAFGVRLYNNYQTAFSTIGDGLTDTEASNLYTIVQNFQTSLNRQIP
jgi:hypothetical protein